MELFNGLSKFRGNNVINRRLGGVRRPYRLPPRTGKSISISISIRSCVRARRSCECAWEWSPLTLGLRLWRIPSFSLLLRIWVVFKSLAETICFQYFLTILRFRKEFWPPTFVDSYTVLRDFLCAMPSRWQFVVLASGDFCGMSQRFCYFLMFALCVSLVQRECLSLAVCVWPF